MLLGAVRWLVAVVVHYVASLTRPRPMGLVSAIRTWPDIIEQHSHETD
jgi:hypothetical protein